jgi:hypothetical protein
MPIATIEIFEHTRGRRYSAQLRPSGEPRRVVLAPRDNELKMAVLNVLVKYEKAHKWSAGKVGRPPAARDIPRRLERR